MEEQQIIEVLAGRLDYSKEKVRSHVFPYKNPKTLKAHFRYTDQRDRAGELGERQCVSVRSSRLAAKAVSKKAWKRV